MPRNYRPGSEVFSEWKSLERGIILSLNEISLNKCHALPLKQHPQFKKHHEGYILTQQRTMALLAIKLTCKLHDTADQDIPFVLSSVGQSAQNLNIQETAKEFYTTSRPQ